MYTATNLATRETYNFKSLPALARRLGGDSYQVEHDTAFAPPHRTVVVLRRDRKVDSSHIVTRVRVPSEAVESSE